MSDPRSGRSQPAITALELTMQLNDQADEDAGKVDATWDGKVPDNWLLLTRSTLEIS